MNDGDKVITLLEEALGILKGIKSKDPNLEWKTFKEWSDSGFFIKRGERGTRFDNVVKFSSEQVRLSQPASPVSSSNNSPDIEDNNYPD